MSPPVMILLVLVFVAYTPSPTVAQNITLPELGRKERMDDWNNATKHPAQPLTKADRDYLRTSGQKAQSSGIQTMAAMPGAPRLECRLMIRQKWNDYVNAWKAWHTMKAPNSTSNVTQHQLYVAQHRSPVAPAAHNGPCFLPWHREYLARWENALRKHVSNTSLCYIDWTLDRWMVNPCDSVTFSPDHFGSHTGPLTTGFAKGWTLYPSDCTGQTSQSRVIWRSCTAGQPGKDALYTDAQINTFVNSYTTFGDFCYPRNTPFEDAHGSVHGFVGGTMNSIPCSPNDPIFISHHTNVDRIYQRFRDRFGAANENQYVTWTDIKTTEWANSTALPFNDTTPPMKCSDGLKMIYDENVQYEHVPSTCTTQAACGNGDGKGALWCNTATGRCAAKLKIGGNCQGGTDISCYTESTCATPAKCVYKETTFFGIVLSKTWTCECTAISG